MICRLSSVFGLIIWHMITLKAEWDVCWGAPALPAPTVLLGLFMPGYLGACFVSVGGNRGQGEARFQPDPSWNITARFTYLSPAWKKHHLMLERGSPPERGREDHEAAENVVGYTPERNWWGFFPADEVKSLPHKPNFSQSPHCIA